MFLGHHLFCWNMIHCLTPFMFSFIIHLLCSRLSAESISCSCAPLANEKSRHDSKVLQSFQFLWLFQQHRCLCDDRWHVRKWKARRERERERLRGTGEMKKINILFVLFFAYWLYIYSHEYQPSLTFIEYINLLHRCLIIPKLWDRSLHCEAPIGFEQGPINFIKVLKFFSASRQGIIRIPNQPT